MKKRWLSPEEIRDEYEYPPTDDKLTVAHLERIVEALKNPPPYEPIEILSPARLAQDFERQWKGWKETRRAEQRKKAEAVPVHWSVRRLLGNL